MSSLAASSRSTRHALVVEIRHRLERESFPRIIVGLMLLVAGGVAFLCSAGALVFGLDSMADRYALATSAGYLAFILLIRTWIAVRRGWRIDVDLDVEDIDSLVDTGGTVRDVAYSGGRSGGSGGGGDWRDVPVERVGGSHADLEEAPDLEAAGSAADGFPLSLDLDEGWWLALAVGAALAGLLAMGFIVYSAPLLLAEVALDAALVSTVYRRLRREDSRNWAMTTLRRTWVPALVLVAFMFVLGFALELVAPEARSIGGVIAHVLGGWAQAGG